MGALARQDGRAQHDHPYVHELHDLFRPHEWLHEDVPAHDIGTVDAHSEKHEATNHSPQEAHEPDVQGLLGWHGHLTSRRPATAVCWGKHTYEHAEQHRLRGRVALVLI